MVSYDHRHTGVTEITWARFGELCRELALAVRSQQGKGTLVEVRIPTA